jgi:hypothetical protein
VALVKTALTILFGAIPATIMCMLPFGLILVGSYELSQNMISRGLFSILYAFAAIFGTVSLWAVALRGPSPLVVLGLAVGIATISPFTFAVLSDPFPIYGSAHLFAISTVSPPIVAFYWLASFLFDRYSSKSIRSRKP